MVFFWSAGLTVTAVLTVMGGCVRATVQVCGEMLRRRTGAMILQHVLSMKS